MVGGEGGGGRRHKGETVGRRGGEDEKDREGEEGREGGGKREGGERGEGRGGGERVKEKVSDSSSVMLLQPTVSLGDA